MDNIIIEKVWQEANLLELKVTASSQYVKVFQFCYVSKEQLDCLANEIRLYIYDSKEGFYWETGPKNGNSPGALSLNILPAKITGHIMIEIDIEIEDNFTRAHRCVFYVESELGLLEKFEKRINHLKDRDFNLEIRLNEK